MAQGDQEEQWTRDPIARSEDSFRAMRSALDEGKEPWSKSVQKLREDTRLRCLELIFDVPEPHKARTLGRLWHHSTYLWAAANRTLVKRCTDGLKDPESTPDNRKVLLRELSVIIPFYGEGLRVEVSIYNKVLDRVIKIYGLWDLVDSKVNCDGTICRDTRKSSDPPRDTDSNRIKMVYEALVYLGDLRRYQEDLCRAVPLTGKPSPSISGPTDTQYYRAAIRLFPDDGIGLLSLSIPAPADIQGDAISKLSLIAKRKGSLFDMIYYQQRAYDVISPRNTSRTALKTVFDDYIGSATWSQLRAKFRQRTDFAGLQDDYVYVCGMIYSEEDLDRVHQFPPLYDCLPRRLSILVKTAQVPREELHKLVVMLISTHRASRTNTTRARRIWRQRDREDLAIGTLVGVFRVMFNVCRVEASDHEQDSGAGRFGGEMLEWMALCLPSLRIASKWIMINSAYLERRRNAYGSNQHLDQMWEQYFALIQQTIIKSPIPSLPSKTGPFPEDTDLKGYLPLAPAMTNSEPNHDEVRGDAAGYYGRLNGVGEPAEMGWQRLSDFLVKSRLNLEFAALHGWVKALEVPSYEETNDAGSRSFLQHDETDDPVRDAFRQVLEAPAVEANSGSSRQVDQYEAGEQTGHGADASSDNGSDSEVILFQPRNSNRATVAALDSASVPAPALPTRDRSTRPAPPPAALPEGNVVFAGPLPGRSSPKSPSASRRADFSTAAPLGNGLFAGPSSSIWALHPAEVTYDAFGRSWSLPGAPRGEAPKTAAGPSLLPLRTPIPYNHSLPTLQIFDPAWYAGPTSMTPAGTAGGGQWSTSPPVPIAARLYPSTPPGLGLTLGNAAAGPSRARRALPSDPTATATPRW